MYYCFYIDIVGSNPITFKDKIKERGEEAATTTTTTTTTTTNV